MKTITVSVDEHILDEVRVIAARRRMSVSGLVRDFLGQVAAEESRLSEAREGLVALMDRSEAELGPSYAWNREDAYEGRLLPRHQRSDLRGGGEDR